MVGKDSSKSRGSTTISVHAPGCAHVHAILVASALLALLRQRAGPMGGERKDKALRASAVKHYYMCGRDMKKAVEAFLLEDVDDSDAQPANPYDFIRYWVDQFERHNSIEDAPIAGQPAKLPPSVVDECAERFGRGIEADNVTRRHYSSWEEALVIDSWYQEVCDTWGCTTKTLWRHMKSSGVLLHVKEEVKWPFTPTEEHIRVQCAHKLLRRVQETGGELLDTMLFVDEASIYTEPTTGRWVWCTRQADHPMMLTKALRNSKKDKLKWYLVVNKLLGLVGVYFTTGTTDMPRQFTVSFYT